MADYPRVAGVVTKQGRDISDLCNDVGDRYAFPPRLLVACGLQESRLDEQSERRAVWPDVSSGLFHQTVKYAAAYGLGNGQDTPENIAEVFAELKSNPVLAADIAGQQLGRWWAQEGEGIEALSRYNSPGLAWAANPNRRNIADSWAASARYVVPEEAPVSIYDPETPPSRQVRDWTCSVHTTAWCVQSLGAAVSAQQVLSEMEAANLVSSRVGLHDGSGASLARWLGPRTGHPAWSQYPISWEWLRGMAGAQPIGIGGQRWNHWAAVRDVDGDGLALMNPAPGWRGVYDHLSHEQFLAWGPFAAVVLEGLEEGEDMGQIAELEAQVAELTTLLGEAGRVHHHLVLPDLETAAAVEGLPEAAVGPLVHGALPAAQTLGRLLPAPTE